MWACEDWGLAEWWPTSVIVGLGLGPGLKDQWRVRAGVLCLWACGLHRVGETAKLLTQSNRVTDPRQARMRMGACRRRIDSTLSQLGNEGGVEGRHSLNKTR